MKQVINKNIFYTYFKCNIGCKCSKSCYSVKDPIIHYADYNCIATRTAREVENSMIFYFCGETTEIAMKRVKNIYFCIV